jgi:hypothetical protein
LTIEHFVLPSPESQSAQRRDRTLRPSLDSFPASTRSPIPMSHTSGLPTSLRLRRRPTRGKSISVHGLCPLRRPPWLDTPGEHLGADWLLASGFRPLGSRPSALGPASMPYFTYRLRADLGVIYRRVLLVVDLADERAGRVSDRPNCVMTTGQICAGTMGGG